jgi:hypothetical protein
MKRRLALTAVACFFALTPSVTLAQAKPATPTTTTPAPAAPAKFIPPMKGAVSVEFTRSKPQKVGNEVQTKMKVKNTSKGSIALLSVEQIWYNTKPEIATNAIYRHRALLNPGDVIEFTLSAEFKPNLYTNNLMFKHAYGTVDPKEVKKLP